MIRTLILPLLIISNTLFSQTHKHWFAVKGGMNFCFSNTFIQPNFLSNSNLPKEMNSQSFGVGYTYLRNNSLVLNGDLIYMQKGGYLDDILLNPDTEVDITFRSQHLTIPLKVGVNVGKKFYAQFLFGLSTTFLLTTRFQYDLDNVSFNIKPYAHSYIDLGMNAEARTGYCFSDQLRFFISFTYDHSFFKHKFYVDIPQPTKQMPVQVQYEYASLMIGLSCNINGDWSVLRPKKKRKSRDEE